MQDFNQKVITKFCEEGETINSVADYFGITQNQAYEILKDYI